MNLLDCFAFLWRRPKTDDYREECLEIQEKIKGYKSRIEAFDAFVRSRPELDRAVKRLKELHFATLSAPEEPKVKAMDIQDHTALSLAHIDYKLHWKIRRLFIKLDPVLNECKIFLGNKRKAMIYVLLKKLEHPSTTLQALFHKGDVRALSKEVKRLSLKLHPDKNGGNSDLFTRVYTPLREEIEKYQKKSSASAILADPLPRKINPRLL